jgi:hypothetical protein
VNIGRIVELPPGVGAGGAAACPASGTVNRDIPTGSVPRRRGGTVNAVGRGLFNSVAQL